jgi:alpha-amylase/alpha-mannosidase (GH57 family)
MPHIYVCFLWHMHQPFYKDLVSGEYRLPWTRMHALKDYYGMVKVLEDFPGVRQTFNLVPSMLLQIEDYASGQAGDPFLRCALKPAENLTDEERDFILQYFFQANVGRLINRYPRYAELYELWLGADRVPSRARRSFDHQAIRDLQILSQLAWFDEEFLNHDKEVKQLVRKARDYSLDDQRLIGVKEQEICGKVIPVYREFQKRGQIEVSTTPFYHPILPLLCDSNIAEQAHPYVPLPSRFAFPQDARCQLERSRSFIAERIGAMPVGLWPSEGSVSDDVLSIAADLGYNWIASDNGVLARTLGTDAGPRVTYRPYLWERDGRRIHCLFRDHYLSDLVGFVYSRMAPLDAALHLLERVRENCRPILASGADALVPIFLDGENAWEYYEESGRLFLKELYGRIEDSRDMTALTVSEALTKMEPHRIGHIFPGSWINANFDVWIGAEEDNQAWEYLLRARQTYERIANSTNRGGLRKEQLELAYEELLIAEGSDWCWWYGPEHDSANRPEFDQLFRDHVANVYLALGLSPPEELSRPIVPIALKESHEPPSGPIRATIDGQVTSYFEWMGAGVYRVHNRSGAMHGQRFFVNELLYGSDGQSLFLRLDFVEDSVAGFNGTEVRINIQPVGAQSETYSLTLPLPGTTETGEAALGRIAELRVPLPQFGINFGQVVKFQLSLWHGGLPMDALPPQGWIEMATAESVEWML